MDEILQECINKCKDPGLKYTIQENILAPSTNYIIKLFHEKMYIYYYTLLVFFLLQVIIICFAFYKMLR